MVSIMPPTVVRKLSSKAFDEDMLPSVKQTGGPGMNRQKQNIFVEAVLVALLLTGSLSRVCHARLDGDEGSAESVMAAERSRLCVL